MQPKKNEMTFSLECGTAQKIVTKCIVHFQLHFILNHEILIHWNGIFLSYHISNVKQITNNIVEISLIISP